MRIGINGLLVGQSINKSIQRAFGVGLVVDKREKEKREKVLRIYHLLFGLTFEG